MPLDINDRRDVDGAIQMAVNERLRGDAAVRDLVGAGVYDRVAAGAAFPFVTIPDIQIVENGADCVEAVEAFVTIHVWSRAIGTMEARAIVEAVRAALLREPLDLGARHVTVDMFFEGGRDAGSDDPLTIHRIATFKALVETH